MHKQTTLAPSTNQGPAWWAFHGPSSLKRASMRAFPLLRALRSATLKGNCFRAKRTYRGIFFLKDLNVARTLDPFCSAEHRRDFRVRRPWTADLALLRQGRRIRAALKSREAQGIGRRFLPSDAEVGWAFFWLLFFAHPKKSDSPSKAKPILENEI